MRASYIHSESVLKIHKSLFKETRNDFREAYAQ